MRLFRRPRDAAHDERPVNWGEEFTVLVPAWLVDDPEGTRMRGMDPVKALAHARSCWDRLGDERGLIAMAEVRHHPQVETGHVGRVYRLRTWWRVIWRALKLGRWQIGLRQRA